MTTPSPSYLNEISELKRPLTSLKGVGAKRAKLLAEKGIYTILDLLFFTPIRYEDRSQFVPLNELSGGVSVLVKGTVVFGREERFLRTGKRLFRIAIKDQTGDLELIWFRYRKAHLNRFTQKDLEITAYGKVLKNKGISQMVHPDIALADQTKGKGEHGFYPVYSEIKGFSGRGLRSPIREALDRYQEILYDGTPRKIIQRLGLPELKDALRHIHIPSEGSSIELLNRSDTQYHRRLTFDRFFYVMLNVAYRKKTREKRTGPVFSIPEYMLRNIKECFPFRLTGGQTRAIDEIFKDLNSDRPMNRLLHGDVGCGKTVVAAAASYAAVFNHWQVAVMAPTQVLARQHYLYFSNLSEKMGFRPVLLTGGLTKRDRLDAYEMIKNGQYNLIIGTHALIQEDLSFAKLGLVIIDEQQRFGVIQRAMLDRKGENPNVLIMTATPIPRTLAMTVYADLDISAIKEYPQKHRAVETYLLHESRKREIYNTVSQRMSEGEQVIVICPVIEESENQDLKNAFQMHERLRKLFSPRFCVGLIHGRMLAEEKDRIMEQFRDGRIHLLVGTTVIEVGIHAEGATVMVIEHPERFGLSQLHQLRGRVGRGEKAGICFLVLSKGLEEIALSRLNVLVESHDGFEIAQKDLEIRGQGRIMGTMQAGEADLDFTEVFRDPELLLTAKREAESITKSDPELSRPENRFLRKMIESTFPSIPTDF